MSSSLSPSRKQRKKAKGREQVDSRGFTPRLGPDSPKSATFSDATPAYPLAAFLWPARGGASRWAVFPAVLIVAALFRWTAGFWDYSGYMSPPLHGDFEAQRHWMEITTYLPISQWYFYDLEWWGLDYPPLTAYHSWILGHIGRLFDPTWFAFQTSRGLEDPNLKIFMRSTVIVSEYITYVPAVIFFLRRISLVQTITRWDIYLALVAILMQPATILIDHAHFQYNTVMLGFVVASLVCILGNHYFWACVFFVAALGFKQMALYYAPAMFAFLLGSCLRPQVNLPRLLGIALATILSFVVLFAPILIGTAYDHHRGLPLAELPLPPILQQKSFKIDSKAFYYPYIVQLAQSIHRIFPFARGIFEDKVANVWCFVHTFHKLHMYPTNLLQRLSLGATIASILPPCIAIGIFPDRTLLPWAIATTAWGFFLFSFQVHEKSVLLPLLPMTLMLGSQGGLAPSTRSWITWANILGSWTMFPLLKRDGLRVPYMVLTLFWGWLLGEPSLLNDVQSWMGKRQVSTSTWELLSRLLHSTFYTGMLLWHVLEATTTPPHNKPDLWVVANVLVGAVGFGICYLWCLAQLVQGCYTRSSSWNKRSKRKTQ